MIKTKPQMLLPRQIAEEYNIPIYRIRKWAKEGTIFCVMAGRKCLINRERFEQFLYGEDTPKS